MAIEGLSDNPAPTFHFGITCPPAMSHVNNMLLVGKTLRERGHKVTVFHISDLGAKVAGENLQFVNIGAGEFPPGALAQIDARSIALRGWQSFQFAIQTIARFCSVVCRDVPGAAQEVNVMLVDQDEPAGGSVAELLGIPFITISNSLAMNPEPGVPPGYTDWKYYDTAWARARNGICYWAAGMLTHAIRDSINVWRKPWGLAPQRGVSDSFSRFAQMSQQPPAFDFPHKELPESFHYVGPLRSRDRQEISFPWERLDGRRLVYASLGTLLSRHLDVFQLIAETCRNLDAQLVISHVNCLDAGQAETLAAHALVVPYAPQFDLLAKAYLTITHGGLNTVLDSLSHGVPVVAIPCMNDAFGTGARLEWTGAGKAVPWAAVRTQRLRDAVHEVFGNEKYYAAAGRIRDSIMHAGGLTTAVDIIEKVAMEHAR